MGAWAEELTLTCTGVTEIPDNTIATTTVRPKDSFPKTGNTLIQGRKNLGAVVNFYMNEDQTGGWVQLPSSMRPPIGASKKDKFELTELSVTESEIRAKFRINFINKPNIIINRNTGTMDYKASAWPRYFNGECEKVDTSKKKF
tara:strand:+ start:351 stop:782 length:432 start_codon:yes stop_codon:yes gene_type:complete